MDVRTWTTLSRLLDDALDLAPADRAAWLEGLADEHERFKPRLRAMLERASSLGEDPFLATLPRFEPSDAGGEPDDGPAPGVTVGPFRLTRQLATGGQGAVWLAERADGLVRRPVAVKLPHGLAVRPGLRDRMAREREILATLTHPNIARLYDAGVTQDGAPFLALEYVEGTPIDRYCADHHLDVRARVRLFLQVVGAVAYAHGQLVIHRDLKPSNVLVTPDGQVRLLDFGIARMLDDAAPGDSTLTELGGRAMTLAYASPEQVSRAPLGVATDVYSLGVMLYELLAGVRPYETARDTSAALEEAILTAEPRRPSDRVADRALGKAIRGDLDTIVLQALEKAPADRYTTAAAMGEDLERYLDGRAVEARPDSRWYRARKFVVRHRVVAGAAAAVLAAVCAGAGMAIWQAGVARTEQQRAEDVKAFIVSMFQDANLDTAGAGPVSVRDLLARAEARLAALPGGAVKAELLIVVGEALLALGDTGTLEAVAERAVAEAAAVGDDALVYRARVLTAWAHMYRGRPDAMTAEIEAIAPALERDTRRFARELSDVWRLRASAAIDAGRYEDAVAAAVRALEFIERAAGVGTASTLSALTTLSEAHTQAGQSAEALAIAERAMQVADAAYGMGGDHPYVLGARVRHADALGRTGDIAGAVDGLHRVVADASRVFGPDGRTVGFYLQRLANLQIRLGRVDAAIDSITRGAAIIERHAEAGSPTRAAFDNTAGHALLFAGRALAALPPLTRSLDTAVRVFGPQHANTLNVRAGRAMALALAGRGREADGEITRTLDDMRESGQTLPRPLYVAGLVNRRHGRLEPAATLLDRAERAVEDDASLLWQICVEQGLLRLDAGRREEARTYLERATAMVREMGIADHPGTAALRAARERAAE